MGVVLVEYLKLALTYATVGIVFTIPSFIRWIKTKNNSVLKYRLKLQFFLILIIVLATLTSTHLLKIDTKVFDMLKDAMAAIGINIVLLFVKKK